MGKYELDVEPEDWSETLYFLNGIANELAEANRLKRLELSHQQFNSLLDKKELEDNA